MSGQSGGSSAKSAPVKGEKAFFARISDAQPKAPFSKPGDGQIFYVQFNPKELKFDDGAKWEEAKDQKEAPPLQYSGGQPATMSMELIFDTTDSGEDVRTTWVTKLLGFLAKNVDGKEGKSPTKRPPVCIFGWKDFTFDCVVEKLGVTYLMFSADGTPLRAKVTVNLKEYGDADASFASSKKAEVVLNSMFGGAASKAPASAATSPAKSAAAAASRAGVR